MGDPEFGKAAKFGALFSNEGSKKPLFFIKARNTTSNNFESS